MRVLLINDSLNISRILFAFLNRKGFDVCCADSGTTGIEAAKQFRPDVVLLNLIAPDMTSQELATTLRQEVGLANVTIISINGYDSDPRRNSEAGVDSYLLKPLILYKILETIRRPQFLEESVKAN